MPGMIFMHIVLYSWFFEVLTICESPIFSFFMTLFSRMGLPKRAIVRKQVFFEELIS